MPLIQLTTTSQFHPQEDSLNDTSWQSVIRQFATDLPEMFCAGASEFHLDAATTPEAVQVTHRQFHTADVNTPDVWMLVQFSEAGFSENEQLEIRDALKKMIFDWFPHHWTSVNFAVDCFWGPSHGFLMLRGTELEW